MCNRLKISLGLIVAGALASLPLLASSAVVGLVAGSLSTSIDGHPALPQMAVFAGDRLQVGDGTAVVALSNGGRLMFSRSTRATFQRDQHALTVILSAGSLSLYYPGEGVGLRVQAGSTMVEAVPGYKTIGDIAMMDGTVDVKTKEGALRVNGIEGAMEVAKGKILTVASKSPVASPNVAGRSVVPKAGVPGEAAVPSVAIVAAEPTPPRPSPFQPPCVLPTIRECEE